MGIALTVVEFLIGGLIEAAILWFGYTYQDAIPAPSKPSDAGERLAYALKFLFPMAAIMITDVTVVALNRGADPAISNPLAGNDRKIQLQKNVLTNTTEQLLIAALLMLVYASITTCRKMLKVLPMYSISFVVGRVLFGLGYRISPKFRSVGMSINFYITGALSGYIAYTLYGDLSSKAAVGKTEL